MISWMSNVSMLRWMVLGGVILTLAACEPRTFVSESIERLLTPNESAVRYRRLVLPNALRVILVSDPRVDTSAAAMAVGTGFLNDPERRPGLAHFTEHMLFLGTEKYPQAGSYQEFMTNHSGSSNAYTSVDHTNYFFDVAHDAFDEGLDRFSQFFVAPLFNDEFTSREVHAVDSEHSKNIENDFWRASMVQRKAYRPEHPLSHFGTGNLATLEGVGRAELMQFYTRHYSSNRMTLAVVSNRPLDELEAMVRKRFSAVPNRDLPPTHVPTDFMPRGQTLRLLTIEPVKDVRMLSMEFPLPSLLAHYRAQPLEMVSTVLGDEGQGSLLSLLKEEGLATELSVGSGYETADFSSLHISVQLTPQGLQQYQQVLQLTMGAIAKLRETGIPRYLFDERRVMSEINYRYRDQMDSASIASRLSAAMQDLPLQDLPEGQFILRDYDPALYGQVLQALTPDNMVVTLMAKGVPTQQTEQYYRARYGLREIPGEPYQRLVAAQVDPRWHLPAANPYIPRRVKVGTPEGALKLTQTTLLHLERDGFDKTTLHTLQGMQQRNFAGGDALVAAVRDALPAPRRSEYLAKVLKNSLALPRRLMDNEKGKIWYLPDWRFRQPKAEIRLKIYTESASTSARNEMLGRMYAAAFEESQNERAYPLRQAGLGFSVGWSVSGVRVDFSGYSDRMLDLLGDMFRRLKQIDLSRERFAALKEQVLRGLQSERFAEPYRQSRYYSGLLLDRPSYTREELERELAPMTLDDVRGFAAQLYRRTYIEGVVVGNLAPARARGAIESAYAALEGAPLPESRRVREQVHRVPEGDWDFTEKLPVSNSYVGMYFDAGMRDPDKRGALLVINRMLNTSFYYQLRTQQQLGYIVYGGMSEREKILSLIMIVQSGQYGPSVLQARMDAFVPAFINEFRNVSAQDFDTLRKAVIDAKLERDNDLGAVADKLFWQAFKHDERWDHVSTEIEAVQRLTKDDAVKLLERVLGSDTRRRISIRLVGKEQAVGKPEGKRILPGDPLLKKAS